MGDDLGGARIIIMDMRIFGVKPGEPTTGRTRRGASDDVQLELHRSAGRPPGPDTAGRRTRARTVADRRPSQTPQCVETSRVASVPARRPRRCGTLRATTHDTRKRDIIEQRNIYFSLNCYSFRRVAPTFPVSRLSFLPYANGLFDRRRRLLVLPQLQPAVY